MAKKQSLPRVKQQQEADAVKEIELREDERTTVSSTGQVQWITIRVPICQESRESLAAGYLPVRADTGPRRLPQEDRVSLKAVVQGLNDSGATLKNGRKCGDNRTTAIRWLLERITEAMK